MSIFPSARSSSSLRDLTGDVTLTDRWPAARGGFADVWIGLWRDSEEGCKVGVKVLRTMEDQKDSAKTAQRLRRELRIWQNLTHENVLPLFGTTSDFGSFPSMVCPWQENGNLNQYLDRQGAALTLRQRFRIVKGVVDGLSYLHSFSVVHGDLTGSNVLISITGDAYLSDFGLSIVMAEIHRSSNFTTTVGGALRWTDPGLYPDLDLDRVQYPSVTTHSDVYSFGSILLQTLSSKVPYDGLGNTQVLFQLIRGIRPHRPSESVFDDRYWDFIQRCWADPPERRLNVSEVNRKVANFLTEVEAESKIDVHTTRLTSKCRGVDQSRDIDLSSFIGEEHGRIRSDPNDLVLSSTSSTLVEDTQEPEHGAVGMRLRSRSSKSTMNPPSSSGRPDRLYARVAKLQSYVSSQGNALEMVWRSEGPMLLFKGSSWDLCSGVLGQTDGKGDRKLLFTRLPSRSSPSLPMWGIDDIGFDVCDFALDPFQDLLVAIEEVIVNHDMYPRVHLRSLSTGDQHPLASSSPLPLPTCTVSARISVHYSIRISGIHVGVMLHRKPEPKSAEFVALNWKTGSTDLHLAGYYIYTFAFLTDLTVMVGRRDPLADLVPTLEVFTLERPASDRSRRDIQSVCSFRLPACFKSFRLSVHSEPSGLNIPSLPASLSECQIDKMLAVDLEPIWGSGEKGNLVMLIPLSTLLVKLVEARDILHGPFILDWDSWGPSGTRVLPLSIPRNWDACIRGLQCILPVRRQVGSASYDGPPRLHDFNMISIKRPSSAPTEGGAYMTGATSVTIDVPDSIPAPPCTLTTALPYCIQKIALPRQTRDIVGVLVSDEDLIVISTRKSSLV